MDNFDVLSLTPCRKNPHNSPRARFYKLGDLVFIKIAIAKLSLALLFCLYLKV
jgi:hypothetical protein